MNVVVLEDSSKAFFGGGQRVTLEVVRALKGSYSIYVFDCGRKTVFLTEVSELADATYPLHSRGKIRKGSTSASFSLGIREVLLTPFHLIADIISVYRTMARQGMNPANTIVYAATKKMLLIAWGLKLWKQYRFVFHAHSIDNRRSLFFRLILPALKGAEQVICVSHAVAQNYDLPRSVVIYNPSPQRRSSGKRSQASVVSMFSSLIPWKGGEVFAKAVARIDDAAAEFRVYGAGPEYDRIAEAGGSRIRMMGFCADAPREMDSSVDILVVPSIAPEACPMSVIEAFTCGIPVIATNIGGQAELVQHGKSGLLVEPGDPEKLATAIKSLLDDSRLYRDLSIGAMHRSNLFAPDLFKNRIRTLFQDLFPDDAI